MKRTIGGLILALGFICGVSAQDKPAVPQGWGTTTGQHYEIFSPGGSSEAEVLLKELELRFDVYNRLFRFNPQVLTEPLRVRLFYDKGQYDAYVTSKAGSTRDGAVYLHYGQVSLRELVLHRGSPAEARMLPHQAFIQFFRGFIPYPPAWMREGFAIYFDSLVYDRNSGTLQYEENLAWLDTVKKLEENALETVLQAESRGLPEHFQGVSWGLVSFLLNIGRDDYFRALTDSFMVLSPTAGEAENSAAVFNRLTLFTSMATLSGDYQAYLESRKPFAEFMEAGQRAYTAKDALTAEICFIGAMNQKPGHYAPYYYLGLLAYNEKSYDLAEQYYQSALEFAADKAMVQYALGLNAAAAGRNAKAVAYLKAAVTASPERYKSRTEGLINRLQTSTP
jgi:tetratricopeptide (TPR) repeat protein